MSDHPQGTASTPPTSAAPTHRLPLLALALIVAIGALLRVMQIGESLWLDELHTAWTVADGLAEVAPRAAIGNHSPLYFWFAWGSTRAIGMSELALRLPSTLAGVLLMVLVYWVIRRWTHGVPAGLLGALLIAVERNCIFYAQEARPYACVQLVGLVHVMLFGRLMDVPSARRHMAFVLVGILLFYLHYTAALLFAAEIVCYAVLWARRAWRPRLRLRVLLLDMGIVAVCGLPAAPHLMQIASRRSNWALFVQQWPIGIVQDWFPWWSCVWLPIVLCGAMLGSRWLWRKRPFAKKTPCASQRPDTASVAPRRIVLVACWLGVPLVVAWMATSLDLARLFFPRYCIVAVPALAMAAALGCALCPARAARWVYAAIVALAAVAQSGIVQQYWRYGHLAPLRNQDWRSAVRLLNDRAGGGQAPVLVRSGLIEADQLREDSGERFREYCLLPVLGMYRFQGNSDRLIPLSTSRTASLQDAHRRRIAEAGGAWFLVVGKPQDVSTMARQLEQGWERYGVRLRVAERHAFGHVTVLRLAAGP